MTHSELHRTGIFLIQIGLGLVAAVLLSITTSFGARCGMFILGIEAVLAGALIK